MFFAHGNPYHVQKTCKKTYSFWSLKTLSSHLCQNSFISPETEEKLSNIGRIQM